jgi:hypothetical protein
MLEFEIKEGYGGGDDDKKSDFPGRPGFLEQNPEAVEEERDEEGGVFEAVKPDKGGEKKAADDDLGPGERGRKTKQAKDGQGEKGNDDFGINMD